ncbi:MAG: hypothetical protein IT327_16020 [Anaerolineae bacterium]|nr:hypothetical protein [Anaerolineae bacterium]
MQTIAIFQEPDKRKRMSYRAIRGQQQAEGKTPGQALDSLEKLSGSQDENALVILQRFQADAFFNQAQQEKLAELMGHLQETLKNDNALSPAERAELERLIDAEWAGAIARAASLIAVSATEQSRPENP